MRLAVILDKSSDILCELHFSECREKYHDKHPKILMLPHTSPDFPFHSTTKKFFIAQKYRPCG